MNIDNFLKNIEADVNAGLDHIEEVKALMPTIIDCPACEPDINLFPDGTALESPRAQLIYNSKGEFLGATGNRYESTQPKDLLDAFVKGFSEAGLPGDLSKLDYLLIRDGRMMLIRIPVAEFVLPGGDTTIIYLTIETGFAGYCSTRVSLYTYRLVCKNGMVVKGKGRDLFSAKHTERMNLQAIEWLNVLGGAYESIVANAEAWVKLKETPLTKQRRTSFVKNFFNIDQNQSLSDLPTRTQNRVDALQAAISEEIEGPAESTLWGLLQGATRYTNHYAERSGSEEYIIAMSGRRANDRAYADVLSLV